MYHVRVMRRAKGFTWISARALIFSRMGNTGNMAAIASFNQHKSHAWIEQEANCTEIFVGVIHSELPVESAYHFLHSKIEDRKNESQSRHVTMQNTRPGLVCSMNTVDFTGSTITAVLHERMLRYDIVPRTTGKGPPKFNGE